MTVVFCIVLVLMSCFRCGLSAAIRNPLDLDRLIDLDHKYLTYGSHHNSDDVIDTMQYYFRRSGRGEYTPLKRNPSIDLNTPLCYVEREQLICEYDTKQKAHFYSSDDNTVAVSVTNENGTLKLKGLVSDGKTISEINPLQADGLPNNRFHVIKKRWAANMIHRQDKRSSSKYKSRDKKRRKKPKKGKTVSSYSPFPTKTRSRYKDVPDVTAASDYCIDVLCVVDYSIFKKFKDAEKSTSKAIQKIRYYYAHIVNGINMRFTSIAQKDLKITVRLAGYFIAKRPNDLKFIDSKRMAREPSYRVNSNYTLTQLDKYLRRMKSRNNVLPDFNHAMLFLEYAATNLGGTVLANDHIDEETYQYAFKHGQPKDGISGDDGGTSFVGGICSDSKSTSLVVDHGAYTAAGIGTHELGHNLGVLNHDGEGSAWSSACNASRNYIMAPASYLIDESNLKYSFSFSKCSLTQIKTHLDKLIKMKRNCLQCSARVRGSREDQLIDREVQMHLATLPGTTEDVHAQCRQLYGQGSFMCPPKSPDEMCYRMYCYDPDRSACAIISEQMAATGTPCGRYKVCKMGKCVRDSNGRDVPDDCPYPDIPTYGAHCEDATPFMCKNERFRQKCCKSCNKKFSAEEACKDSHILINGMTCMQLMSSIYGRPGCASDFNVQNMCCLGCKRLQGKGGLQIHLDNGSQSRSSLSSRRYTNTRTSGQYSRTSNGSSRSSSSSSRSKSRTPARSSSKPRGSIKVLSRTTTRTPFPSASCTDSKTITFNNLPCPVLIKTDSRFCCNNQVKNICCKSCYKYNHDSFNKC